MEKLCITLQKPEKSTVKGPLLLMFDEPLVEDGKIKTVKDKSGETVTVMKKTVVKLVFGESVELPGQTAYEVAAKYKGLVSISPVVKKVAAAAKAAPAAPENKMLKEEATK